MVLKEPFQSYVTTTLSQFLQIHHACKVSDMEMRNQISRR